MRSACLFIGALCGVEAFAPWGARSTRARTVSKAVSERFDASVKSMAIESPPATQADDAVISDVFIRSLTHGDEMQGSDILVATLEMAGVDTT